MYSRISRIIIISVALTFVFSSFSVDSIRADDQPLVAYSQGVLQSDGTILYSVLIASGQQPLTNVTVSSTIPAEAVSAAAVIAPANAVLVATPEKNTVQWQVSKLDAATIVGPFTYRVTFPTDFKKPPASTDATVIWTEPSSGSVKADQLTGSLMPFVESGDIQITSLGTIDAQGNAQPVFVGDTGIAVYVPDKAVSDPITLHFTRLPFTDQTTPKSSAETWWCALVKVESDAPVTLTKPILIGLPTRQILTPGMTVQLLTRNTASEDWQPLETAQGMAISTVGNLAVVMITGKIPTFLAAGVEVKERQISSLPVAVVSAATGFAGNNIKFSSTGMSFAGKTR